MTVGNEVDTKWIYILINLWLKHMKVQEWYIDIFMATPYNKVAATTAERAQ